MAAVLLGTPALINTPFILAGAIKIVYDALLYRWFSTPKPPEH